MNCRGLILVGFIAAARAGGQIPVVVEQSSGTRALLQAVSAVSDKVVWVSGHSGAVLRTTDGGDHWDVLPIAGAERLEFRAIRATSEAEAWVMSAGNGSASRIYHTADKGKHWVLQFTNADSAAFYDCLAMFDRQHGVAFSDAAHGRTTVLRTMDGGNHWDVLGQNAVPAALPGEGGFASSGGCAISVGKHGWIAAGTPRARVFATDDAGATWMVRSDSAPVVHGNAAGWTGLSFRDANNGIGVAAIIGGNYTKDTSRAAVAITSDGGRNWTVRNRPSLPGALFGVTLVPSAGKNVAVAASLGGLMLTTDLGESWTALTTSPYWSVGAAGKRAWGVGPGGRITRVEFR